MTRSCSRSTTASGSCRRTAPSSSSWQSTGSSLHCSGRPRSSGIKAAGRFVRLARFDVSDFSRYLTSSFLLYGAWLALQIAAAAMVGGLALGLVLALMRLSPVKLLSGLAWTYIWFLRGTPLLLQLIFLYDALPAVGIRMPPLQTAILGFALNEAAFSAEIIRGGILSVHRTQAIAAASLGMGTLLTMRRIILPQ